jgi:hypothetical protein
MPARKPPAAGRAFAVLLSWFSGVPLAGDDILSLLKHLAGVQCSGKRMDHHQTGDGRLRFPAYLSACMCLPSALQTVPYIRVVAGLYAGTLPRCYYGRLVDGLFTLLSSTVCSSVYAAGFFRCTFFWRLPRYAFGDVPRQQNVGATDR